jgi:hypothetical protein
LWLSKAAANVRAVQSDDPYELARDLAHQFNTRKLGRPFGSFKLAEGLRQQSVRVENVLLETGEALNPTKPQTYQSVSKFAAERL